MGVPTDDPSPGRENGITPSRVRSPGPGVTVIYSWMRVAHPTYESRFFGAGKTEQHARVVDGIAIGLRWL